MDRSKHRGFSFEFFPPKTEAARVRLRKTVDALGELQPNFVSVTFGAGGSTREGSFQTTAELLRETKLNVTPHLSCIGSTREQLEEQLRMYRSVGVQRVVALRGDVPAGDEAPAQTFHHANELVEFIKGFGGFHISVGCYPEFHPEASDPASDMQYFARKVAAGADEAITQYFYTNEAYYRFVDDVAKLGVSIPIVPGLMPITEFAQVVRFSKFCGADIPMWIRKRMESLANDPAGQAELGIELATRQAEDLLRQQAPGLHFYTLNRAEPTQRVWDNLGLSKHTAAQGLPPAASKRS
jgi:methylenetetrahydrofolate reductase (NADPH)